MNFQGQPIMNIVELFLISNPEYEIIHLNKKKIKLKKFRNRLRNSTISNLFS